MRIHQLVGVSVASLALAVSGAAMAQPDNAPGRAPGQRMGPPRLTEEEQEQVWTVQAHGIASQYELNQEKTDGLTGLYLQHRKQYNEAMDKLREEMFSRRPGRGGQPGEVQEDRQQDDQQPQRGQEDRRDRFDRGRPGQPGGQPGQAGEQPERGPMMGRNPMMELREQHRDEMEIELQGIFNEEQLKEVLPLISSFSQAWDQMVHEIIGFNLDPANQMIALRIIGKYIVESEAMRTPMAMRPGAPDDQNIDPEQRREQMEQRREEMQQQRDEMRQKMQAAREKLLFSLGEVLTEDQLNQFDEATSRSRGRDRGGRGGRGGGGGNDV